MGTTITARLADALRALLTDYRIQNDLRDDAASTAAHEALADYDNRKPEPPSLADALRYALDRVTLAAINAPDDYNKQSVQHMLDYTKGMRGKLASAEREMRAALAAYDAQQLPTEHLRAKCQAGDDNDGAQRIRVFVKLEGGLVQWVGTSSKVPVDVAIIDYDTEGASEDEVTAIPQDDGGEADAIARIDTASYDPEFVDRTFDVLRP